MRIGIDFHSAEREGSGNCTYIRNLVEALLKIDHDNEYFLYVTNISYPYYEKLKRIQNVHLCLIRSNNPFLRILLLGLKTLIDKIDVLHVQYIAPLLHRGKLVVTIHDISFLHFPECFRKFEQFYLKILIPINIKKADKILTVSKYSRKDIIRNYNTPPKKVIVTYDAVKPIFKPLKDLKKGNEILKYYGISNKFIFYVGRIDQRKNIPGLIKAFMWLKKTRKIPHELVIAGKRDFLPPQTQKVIEFSQNRKDIVFTGYLSEDHLCSLYSLADVFVYPSLYEGFGLPCLEAMACGCPVVSSNVSSLPEIVDSVGLLVDPLDVKKLAIAIHKVISNHALKKELRDKGLKRSKLFSWVRTASKTLAVYKSVLQNPTIHE